MIYSRSNSFAMVWNLSSRLNFVHNFDHYQIQSEREHHRHLAASRLDAETNLQEVISRFVSGVLRFILAPLFARSARSCFSDITFTLYLITRQWVQLLNDPDSREIAPQIRALFAKQESILMSELAPCFRIVLSIQDRRFLFLFLSFERDRTIKQQKNKRER